MPNYTYHCFTCNKNQIEYRVPDDKDRAATCRCGGVLLLMDEGKRDHELAPGKVTGNEPWCRDRMRRWLWK